MRPVGAAERPKGRCSQLEHSTSRGARPGLGAGARRWKRGRTSLTRPEGQQAGLACSRSALSRAKERLPHTPSSHARRTWGVGPATEVHAPGRPCGGLGASGPAVDGASLLPSPPPPPPRPCCAGGDRLSRSASPARQGEACRGHDAVRGQETARDRRETGKRPLTPPSLSPRAWTLASRLRRLGRGGQGQSLRPAGRIRVAIVACMPRPGASSAARVSGGRRLPARSRGSGRGAGTP